MVRVFVFLALLITGILEAQEVTSPEAKAKATIDTFFKGFHEGDIALMKSVMHDKIVLQTVAVNREGKDILSIEDASKLLQAIENRPADQKWDERLLDYVIKIDANMANVWTPYEFWYNGSFSHCGVNSFQLFNDNGTWKIIYLIDTRHKNGCDQ